MTEFIAKVIIERMDVRTMPSSVVRRGSAVAEPRKVQVRTELATFTIRAKMLSDLISRVQGVLGAALPDGSGMEGDPAVVDSDLEEEDPDEEDDI